MPSERGFEVEAQTLRAHAGGVDHVTDMVEQGRSAASSVDLGRDAYGRLCQFIPSLLDPVQDSAISALTEAATTLRQTAADLRTTARRYEASDQQAADLFNSGELSP